MYKISAVLSFALVLTACGGGGGSDPVVSKPINPSSISSILSSSSSSLASSIISTSSISSVSSVGSAISSSSVSSSLNGELSCEAINTVYGFASINDQDKAYDVTGGADAGQGNYEVIVTNGVELRNAVYGSASNQYKDKPITVYVEGKITWANSNNSDIRLERSHVSIIGRGESAAFEGVGIEIRPANNQTVENIVIRNMKMGLVPQKNGSGDIISLNASGTGAKIRNIWIDHNELYNNLNAEGCTTEDCRKDFYDELVSGRGDISNITISNNYLHDSWKTSLWGSSDDAAEDVGRRVTFHHNYWHNVNSRLPLYRYGYLHMFNNYYENVAGSGINLRMDARGLIDGNVFENVKNPLVSIDSPKLGYWTVGTGEYANSFVGVTHSNGGCSNGSPPCYSAQDRSTDPNPYTPNYDYSDVITPTVDTKAFVKKNAGVGKISECL